MQLDLPSAVHILLLVSGLVVELRIQEQRDLAVVGSSVDAPGCELRPRLSLLWEALLLQPEEEVRLEDLA